jgi:hypothetical protein
MESLRRLRIVWLVLCGMVATVMAIAWYGGTPERIIVPAFIGIALVAAAAGVSTWFGVLSCLWLGGLALVLSMVIDKGTRGDIGQVLLIGGGGYIVFAALTWIVKPLFQGRARP